MSLESRIADLAAGIAAYLRDSVVPRLVPEGGTPGQLVARKSGGGTNWVDAPTGGGGGGTYIHVGPTPPPSPVDGQLWVQTL